MATAVLPFILVGAVNKPLYKINFLAAVLYGYGIIILNDVLIRMYAGGTYDQAGKAWITLFSFIAYSLSSFCMLIYAFSTVEKQVDKSIQKQRMQNVFKVLLCGIFIAALYTSILMDK
jgi:hypothetical protein